MDHLSKQQSLSTKEVYSPYDISIVCQVDLSTVNKWLEEGRLDSFQVPGGHLRVRHRDFAAFVKDSKLVKVNLDQSKPAKARVLIVEDDPDLLEIIAELLHDEPRVEVKMESDGFSAGLLVESWHPDLILLDFLMPKVSGFEVCRKIRNNPKTRDVPVMALTSLATARSRQEVVDSGVSDFLAKPFRSDDLLAKVRALLGLE